MSSTGTQKMQGRISREMRNMRETNIHNICFILCSSASARIILPNASLVWVKVWRVSGHGGSETAEVWEIQGCRILIKVQNVEVQELNQHLCAILKHYITCIYAHYM